MYSIIKLKPTLMVIVLMSLMLFGCQKFLDEKPNKKLVVPSTLKDLQALLDDNGTMNTFYTGIGEASADNYYLLDATWASSDDASRNTYLWENEIVFQILINPWQNLYIPVNHSNVVLEQLASIESNNSNLTSWKNIKGSALFFRAKSFLILATTWAKAYDASTAASDLGIALRLDPDFNQTSVRSSVKDSYEQIISDLTNSIDLLPIVPTHVMRPSKPAAYALLSRTYLAMRQYDKAELYADSCLQLFNNLIDYNDLTYSAPYPISQFNREVIFNTNGAITLIGSAKAKIDSGLYDLYENNDLRKLVFFARNADGSMAFKGSYFGSGSLFTGIAADELYLTKAECLARRGTYEDALSTLNVLLKKRFDKNNFTELTANSPDEALKIILQERRKELLMRDLRWMDLKRLNKEPGNETTIRRLLNNKVYELKPNENRYALPFPQTVIDLSGMPQNPR